jgi:hypothetical protein
LADVHLQRCDLRNTEHRSDTVNMTAHSRAALTAGIGRDGIEQTP